MRMVKRPLACAAVVLGAASLLAGCDTIRSAAGQDKQPPDEFAVVTKAPLIIPPDYNLRPPKPGAAPQNEVEPSEAAQQSLFGTGAGTQATEANLSEGEKSLLANAGAQNADPAIRQDIATDRNKDEEAASDDFTKSVLFWTKPKDEGLDPDAALKAGATGPVGVKPAATGATTVASDSSSKDATQPGADTTTTTGATAQAGDASSATIEKKKKSDSGSSVGSWFDWF